MDRLYTSESDVYIRQILTYKDDPRTERVNYVSVPHKTTFNILKCHTFRFFFLRKILWKNKHIF